MANANFLDGYRSRFRSRRLFKGCDFHKVAQLSTSIEEMDAVTLNYWLSEFVMEVAKKSVGEISTEDCLWNNLWYPTLSRLIISNDIQVILNLELLLTLY